MTFRWLGLVLALAPARWALAQPYEIAWHTADGGGATGLAGGTYGVGATAGQPDAGGPHVGGAYAVRGGFWSIVASAGGPQVDLAIAKLDDPDPVFAGATLAYTIQVTNLGPGAASGMTLVDTLPAGVTFLSSTPGPPACTHAGGSVTCALGGLAPAASHAVTVMVGVGASLSGTIANTAAVVGNESDPALANNTDIEPTSVLGIAPLPRELSHGSRLLLAIGAGGVDVYRVRQQPFASYEVVADATSGDIGAGQGPALDRTAADASTVLQTSVPVGAGPSRSLRWINTTGAVQDAERIRVRSLSCGSDCGSDDVYRIRACETTGRLARFNNSGSQVTVILIQNAGSAPVSGRIAFWSVGGALLHEQAFDLAPHGLLALNTAGVPPLQGQAGSVTVAHDGPYGTLAGKAVSVEPATGFSFDSLLEWRPR